MQGMEEGLRAHLGLRLHGASQNLENLQTQKI